MKFRLLSAALLLVCSLSASAQDLRGLRPLARAHVEASSRLRVEVQRRSALSSSPQDHRFQLTVQHAFRSAIELDALTRRESVEPMELKRAVDRVTLHSSALDVHFRQSSFGTVPAATPVQARVRDAREAAGAIRGEYEKCCRVSPRR